MRAAAWNLSTLLPIPFESNPGTGATTRAPQAAATIINGMRPRMIGRALGIGVRVAGRIAGQLLSAPAQPAAAAPQMHQTAPVAGTQIRILTTRTAPQARRQPTPRIQAGKSVGQASRSVSRGVGGFLRPFRRVGGILWLEVTGVFFSCPLSSSLPRFGAPS